MNWNFDSYATHLLIATLLLLSVSRTTTLAQEASPFRWKLQQDNLLTYELQQKTTVSSEIDGRGQQTEITLSMFMDAKVLDWQDEVASIEQSITRITMKMSLPEAGGIKTIELDTGSDEKQRGLADRLLKQIKPLIGNTFTVKMTSRGEIVAIEIPKATMDALREAPSSMQLRKALTADALKQMFGDTAVVFPDQALAVNESWQSTDSVNNAIGTIDRKHIYTNDGMKQVGDKSVVQISMKTEITVKQPGENDAQVDDFQGSGLIWFDPGEGIVTGGEIQNQMKTSRTYRDKVIHTTVDNSIVMKVARK